MSNCQTCGQPILFVKISGDTLTSIDTEPSEHGTIRVATANAERLGPLEVEMARAAGERLYTEHSH